MAKVKVGVVSCGKAGQAHLHWFARNPKCEIIGVWNRTPDKAEMCAEKYGGQVYESWQELAADPEVNLVSLCGAESVRAEQAVFACQQGKHTLCEKPMANSLDECDQMIEAAAHNNVQLMAYFNMRFHPIVDAVTEALEQIGPVYAARIDYTQFRTKVGWRHKLEQGGGVMKSQGVHPIDLMTQWLGEVKSVSGEMLIVHPGREVEDFGLLTMRFDSGAVGEVYACYTDRQDEAMFGSLHGMHGKLDFVLSPYKPELNTVTLFAQNRNSAVFVREPDLLDPVYPGLMDCSKRAIDHFVEVLASGKVSALDGRSGRRSIEIVMAGYESQRRGTKIHLPLNEFSLEGLQNCFKPFESNGYELVD